MAVALLLGGTLTACGSRAPDFRGQVLDPPRPVPDLALPDQHGQTFRLSDQRGRVVLFFFGYTHCPDVCPTTLGAWKRVHDALGQDAEEVRFVFVTVDPERDTPQRLQEHLALFQEDFVGVTGSPERLRTVYETFGVFFEKDTTGGSAVGYLVSHTATAFLVDGDGQWRLRHTFGTPVEDIVHDIRELLK
jgi:protein SCO1/2